MSTKVKSSSLRPWLVFLGCCFLSAGGFALVFDVVGIYLDPVSESLSIDLEQLTLWLGIESVIEFIIMPFAGKLFSSKRIGLYITIAAILVALGTFGFSLCTKVWHFIVCGALIGCGMPFLFGLPQSTLIGNWFGRKHQGRMLGIAMACEGIFAMIWAPLFMYFLQKFGWQTTYIINAIFIAVLIIPWSLFVFKRSPEDLGLEPYGVSEEDEKENPEEADSKVGCKVKTAIKSPAFWMVLISSCLVTFGMGFQDYQPIIATEMLVPNVMTEPAAEMFGATMLSVFSAGTLVGTIVFGFLIDKIGMKASFITFLVFLLGAFLLQGFLGGQKAALMVGAFLLGTHNGLASVGYPLLVRRLFGGKNFSQIYSFVNMCTTLLGGFTVSIVGVVYGIEGSADMMILTLGIGIAVVLLITSIVALAFVGKIKWDDTSKPEEITV